MGENDFIALVLISAVAIAALIYFIIKNNGKNHRIAILLKSHRGKIKVLLDRNKDKEPTVSSLLKDEKNKILSLSDNDWLEWDELIKKVNVIGNQYPDTLYEFISEYFPSVKERYNYKKTVTLFSPIHRKVSKAIVSMTLDELRIIDSDSEETWKQRDDIRVLSNKVQQNYPDGYITYCEIHKTNNPKHNIIVKDKKQIAEFQKLYDESKGYVGWEKKQEEFSFKYWQILNDVRSRDGRYTYDVSFSKPNRRGSLEESKYTVWQGFCENFSSYLLERQTDNFKSNYNKNSEFKNRTRYFYDSVYDEIFDIIKKYDEEIEGGLYVIMIDYCKRNWPKKTYDYHYEHIRNLIDESNIQRLNFSELPLINDNGKIKGIFIFDLITSNDELMKNCKLIIEHFNKSVPLIGYYSMVKEYDEDELLNLSDNYLKPIEEIHEADELPF